MHNLKRFTSQKLRINPEQVQVFTPTPSTYASLMYYTEMDPFTRQPIFVEKELRRKERQKEIVVKKSSVFASENRYRKLIRPENPRRRRRIEQR
jgi:radical SAM superfamily enzyme YgiQ (UPF0313 family)